jgi:hypothetical protein
VNHPVGGDTSYIFSCQTLFFSVIEIFLRYKID